MASALVRKVDLAAFANALPGREGDPQGVAFGVRAQQFRVCLSVHGPDKVAALLRVRIVPANGNALESSYRVADRPLLGDRPYPELGHMVEDACVALNSEGGRERKARRHHRRSLDVGTPVPIFYRDHRMLRDPARTRHAVRQDRARPAQEPVRDVEIVNRELDDRFAVDAERSRSFRGPIWPGEAPRHDDPRLPELPGRGLLARAGNRRRTASPARP